jgi:heme exporter protein D
MNDITVVYGSLVVLLVVIFLSIPVLMQIRKLDRRIARSRARADRSAQARQIILRATDVHIQMHEVIAVGESFEFGSSRKYLHVGSIVHTGQYGYARITEHHGGNFKAVRVL